MYRTKDYQRMFGTAADEALLVVQLLDELNQLLTGASAEFAEALLTLKDSISEYETHNEEEA